MNSLLRDWNLARLESHISGILLHRSVKCSITSQGVVYLCRLASGGPATEIHVVLVLNIVKPEMETVLDVHVHLLTKVFAGTEYPPYGLG